MSDVNLNDIDILMDLDPLDLEKTEGGLDAIIAYHRKKRAEREALPPGTRGKRSVKATKDTGSSVALKNLVEAMKAQAPGASGPVVKRRI